MHFILFMLGFINLYGIFKKYFAVTHCSGICENLICSFAQNIYSYFITHTDHLFAAMLTET